MAITILKKIIMDFGNDLINDKKVVTIGQYDHINTKNIYYVSKIFGEKRLGKKVRINKKEFERLQSRANNIEIYKTY